MKMTFRWYGSQMDPIPLRYIKQIPNMSGVVSSLMDNARRGPVAHRGASQALKQEVKRRRGWSWKVHRELSTSMR